MQSDLILFRHETVNTEALMKYSAGPWECALENFVWKFNNDSTAVQMLATIGIIGTQWTVPPTPHEHQS